jgi:putative transposase
VEANPLRAKMVARAQDWRWSSLGNDPKTESELLSNWPINRPDNWTALVNRELETTQANSIHQSITRDRPLGDIEWSSRMAKRTGMEHTLRQRGRPRKTTTQ